MAGDDGTTVNNGIVGVEGGEGHGAIVRGELHSRVGGILECYSPGNRNLLSELISTNMSTSTSTSTSTSISTSISTSTGTNISISTSISTSNSIGTNTTNNTNNNADDDEDGVCRYAVGAANRAMSFYKICQIRLRHLFPQLAPPSRYNIHEDSIESTAESLANDVMRYLLKEDLYLISRDPISRSMRHNVYQMLNKHSILFASMVNRLNVVPDTAYEAFMGVANELFLHGVFTWAKIVCLYAFMGRLALWARDKRMYTLKKKLPLYVSRYVGEKVAHLIKGYGGWEQLCIEYPVAEEVSGAIWRSLLMTGATLGLIATILSVTS